jgi:hypothetical protein
MEVGHNDAEANHDPQVASGMLPALSWISFSDTTLGAGAL